MLSFWHLKINMFCWDANNWSRSEFYLFLSVLFIVSDVFTDINTNWYRNSNQLMLLFSYILMTFSWSFIMVTSTFCPRPSTKLYILVVPGPELFFYRMILFLTTISSDRKWWMKTTVEGARPKYVCALKADGTLAGTINVGIEFQRMIFKARCGYIELQILNNFLPCSFAETEWSQQQRFICRGASKVRGTDTIFMKSQDVLIST